MEGERERGRRDGRRQKMRNRFFYEDCEQLVPTKKTAVKFLLGDIDLCMEIHSTSAHDYPVGQITMVYNK